MSPEPDREHVGDEGPARFEPHAARAMADMFDDVSGRYDLLNRLMSLGLDGAWRAALRAAVPDDAAVVVDLCTGSSVSLRGLRRPGRLLVGIDVSLRMLEAAARRQRHGGWSPRLVCADGFRLPLPDASVDAVTIAFGVRNLRPRSGALAEIARVLRPGGVLAVLEAAAPAPSAFAPLHRFYLARIVPLLGRLSPEPSAYRYLAESILEFGSGPEFEGALGETGYTIERRHAFLFGATRLWVTRRGPSGPVAGNPPASSQNAAAGADRAVAREREWRVWTGVRLALSAALAAALAQGFWIVLKSGRALPLTGWQRDLALWLLGGGAVVFGARTLWWIARWSVPAPRPPG